MKSSQAQIDSMARRFEKHQIEPLKVAFQESGHLTKAKKMELAAATGLDVEQIASWFSRKRARKRARDVVSELEVAHSQLQQELKQSRESEAELQKELQESKKREADLREENQRLKELITIAEADKQLELLMRFTNGY